VIESVSDMEENDDVTLSPTFKLNAVPEDDPFNLPLSEVRKLNGLNRNFVKKADRRARKGFSGLDGAESKQITDESFYGYGYLDCVTPPYNLDYLTKLYDISPAHHAAVDAKVESVFGLGFDWIESPRSKEIRQRARTDKSIVNVDRKIEKAKVEMNEWLEEINSIDCFDEIMKKAGSDYETTGNGYLEIGRTKSGQVGYIGHVPAAQIRIRRERDGFVQIIGRDVVYFRNFGEATVNTVTDDPNPNEMIHLKKYSPASLYYGVPDIIAAKSALAGNEFASRYNMDYFENKAVPRHAIIVKGGSLSVNSRNKLMEFFEGGLRGKHHRTVYVPLDSRGDKDADIEFKSIEADRQDSSFSEYREANNEEIFMAHRIPASRAGVFKKEAGVAAAKEADKVFKESYSRPEQAIFEKKLAKIIKEISDMVVFKLNELSLVDEDTMSQINERKVRMGIVVPDEIRRDDGMEPRPDGKGDEPWTASAQQEAEQKTQATGSRTRDQQRSAASSTSPGSTGARNAQGEGRKVK